MLIVLQHIPIRRIHFWLRMDIGRFLQALLRGRTAANRKLTTGKLLIERPTRPRAAEVTPRARVFADNNHFATRTTITPSPPLIMQIGGYTLIDNGMRRLRVILVLSRATLRGPRPVRAINSDGRVLGHALPMLMFTRKIDTGMWRELIALSPPKSEQPSRPHRLKFPSLIRPLRRVRNQACMQACMMMNSAKLSRRCCL